MRLRIDTTYLERRLAELLAIASPAGYTDTVVRETCRELERLGVGYDVTRRGAIRAIYRGEQSHGARAIVTHLDTLGAQVKALKSNSRLELVPIGHWSARFAEGARCTIFTEAGSYRGTILPLKASGHTFNEEVDQAPIGWEHVELRIDANTHNRASLRKLGVEIGDFVAVDAGPEFLSNGFIVSRHLDNKAGAAIALAALHALCREKICPPVDTHFVFTISEEVGSGASAVILDDVASVVSIDNGTTAPGQNSSEFGVTIAMADQTGPFDYHLTRKLVRLCRDHDIHYQKDIFRYYRSDLASAVEGGADVRCALITFGIDASHGYERIHMHALRSVAELVTCYVSSAVEIERDLEAMGPIEGFTEQPTARESAPDARRVPDEDA